MACVATSNAGTSPCVTVSSAGGLLNRKRPFDRLFDISLGAAKRPCRCSEQQQQRQQYVNEQEEEEEEEDLECSLSSSKRASAAFSLARAVLSCNNAADENGCSSGEDDVDIPSATAAAATSETCCAMPVLSSSSSAAVARDPRPEGSGARLRRNGSIERPMLFRKILERLQEEIKQIERSRRRSSKPASEECQRDEQTTVTCSRCNAAGGGGGNCDFSKCRLYTFRQLCRVCSKLLKEQERELHEYYERRLTERLSEQYDCFLTFTQEQLNRRFQDSEAPSYIS